MKTVRRFLKKLKNRTSVWSSNSTSGCISEGNETRRISQKGLFTIARMWKQSTSQMNGSFQKNKKYVQSVQFSRSVVSDSLQSHGLQHARLPCPSPTPGVCSNLYPSSQWCHPTISSSVVSFFSCLWSFPASGSLLMTQFPYQVAKVLELQFHQLSFQWIVRTDFLRID